MVETELTFLQVKRKRMPGYAIELCQPPFGKAPKGFNTVDMVASPDKLVVAMVDPEMLVKTNIHQSIVPPPTIGMNHAVNTCLSPDDGLQRAFGGIRHDLGINTITSLEQPKYDGLASSATTTFTANPVSAKVGFICLKLSTQG